MATDVLNPPLAVEAKPSRSLSRHLPAVARVLLGLIFFGAGLAFFLMPMPEPKGLPERAMALFSGMAKSGYLFHLLKITEVAAGLMLLTNRFVPLALALLAPVVVNIVLFHALLAPQGLVVVLVVLALELYLAWAHRDAYRPMLAMRASPS